MKRVESNQAYLFWCLWMFGICGAQRLYTGQIASGLLYFFTFGFFGIGQFLDLFFIPGMVNRRNVYLRGLDFPTPETMVVPPSMKPMQRLLKAAQENGGILSLAQATLYTDMDIDEVEVLLLDLVKKELADIGNDPETGAVRYYFDV